MDVELKLLSALHELQGEVGDAGRQEDEQRRLEDLRTRGHLPQRVDGHQSRYRLHDDEVELEAQGARRDEDHRHVGDEGRARVEEDTHEDGRQGEGQHVDREVEVAVLHHQRHQDGEEGDEGVEHRDAPRLAEVVAPEEGEVDGEEEDEDEHVKAVAHHAVGDLLAAVLASLHFAFERVEHAVGVFIHHVALSDDTLSGHHHTRGG